MNIFKKFNHIRNSIKRRIIISYYMKKTADFLNDLKKFNQFSQYFITKEEAEQKMEEMRKNNEKIYADDMEWWEPTGVIEEFYMATKPGNGGLTPLYGKCFATEFIRRGNSYPTCLSALYPCDKNGVESGSMIGYKCFEETTLSEGLNKFVSQGMIGYGKQYDCYGKIFYDINKLIPIVEVAVEEAKKIEWEKQQNMTNEEKGV